MIRRILVVLALAGVGVFAGPVSPACACSCAAMSPAELLGGADMAFLGTVTKIDRPLFLVNSGASVEVTLNVVAVYKGDVAERIKVTTASDGAACGYDFVEGRRYVVLASHYEGKVTTSLCSGNRDLASEDNPYAGGLPPLPGGPRERWSGALAVLVGLGVVGGVVTLWSWRRHARTID